MEAVMITSFVVLAFALWVWAIIAISKSHFKSPKVGLIVFLAVLVFPVFGPIFFFQFKKNLVVKRVSLFHKPTAKP